MSGLPQSDANPAGAEGDLERLAPPHDLIPTGDVELHGGRATVTAGDHSADAAVRVWFEWERGVRVTASGKGPLASTLMSEPPYLSTTVNGIGEIRLDRLDSSAVVPDGDWTVEAVAIADAGDMTRSVDRVVFQIANFIVYRHRPRETDGKPWRLTLADDRWNVTIDQVPDASDRLRRLKVTGGGAVTHVGQLRRSDGTAVAWHEAVDQLHGLQIFLSFAAGDRVPILLPVGYDAGREPIAHGLRSRHRESYHGRLRWCAPHLIDTVSDLWPRFLDLWHDIETRRLWKIASELYVEAQHGDNLETRLVDAQNLLEVLAWDRLVRISALDPNIVDAKTARWRVRKLLGEIGAPAAVPATLPHARQHWPGWDGPKIITELRNDVVHPTDLEALLRMPAATKLDVVRLAMWYADLALLKLLHHDGPHINRTGTLPLWVGSGEPVPWSSTAVPAR